MNHIQELIKKNEVLPHNDILNLLLDKIYPIDFKSKTYPETDRLRDEPINSSTKPQVKIEIQKK